MGEDSNPAEAPGELLRRPGTLSVPSRGEEESLEAVAPGQLHIVHGIVSHEKALFGSKPLMSQTYGKG